MQRGTPTGPDGFQWNGGYDHLLYNESQAQTPVPAQQAQMFSDNTPFAPIYEEQIDTNRYQQFSNK